MKSDFIVLKCPNCAGMLEVEHGMEHFTCAYCGVEIMARRRGGTVVLQAIESAIGKVQVGTDKTAAELAIVRHQREIDDLAVKVAAAELEQRKEAGGWGFMAFVSLVLALAFVSGHPFWCVTCLAATVAFWVPIYRSTKAHKSWLAEIAAVREDLEARITQKRELADA